MDKLKIQIHKIFAALSVLYGWYIVENYESWNMVFGLIIWLVIFIALHKFVKLPKRIKKDDKLNLK